MSDYFHVTFVFVISEKEMLLTAIVFFYGRYYKYRYLYENTYPPIEMYGYFDVIQREIRSFPLKFYRVHQVLKNYR